MRRGNGFSRMDPSEVCGGTRMRRSGMEPDGSIRSHTGEKVTALRCLVDEAGKVYLVTELGWPVAEPGRWHGRVADRKRTVDAGICVLLIGEHVWFVRSPQVPPAGAELQQPHAQGV